MPDRLDRMLNTSQFTCDRCTMLEQCESCRAMERCFRAAPDIDDWPAWARDQAIDPEPKRLLVALAGRVEEHGYVQDGLAHFARDAGLPKYEGDNETLWAAQELSCARWAWAQLRELLEAHLVEVRWAREAVAGLQQSHGKQGWSRDKYAVEVKYVEGELPEGLIWIRLKPADARAVWRRVA
jgi:hypothetical protein